MVDEQEYTAYWKRHSWIRDGLVWSFILAIIFGFLIGMLAGQYVQL